MIEMVKKNKSSSTMSMVKNSMHASNNNSPRNLGVHVIDAKYLYFFPCTRIKLFVTVLLMECFFVRSAYYLGLELMRRQ
jgi:hypothetical protein